ncbi:protein of unknown function [Ruminococcaceae bacterium BL-4]|nr:protein of unknown function [Ruminococcaceae bacterium BL-4]
MLELSYMKIEKVVLLLILQEIIISNTFLNPSILILLKSASREKFSKAYVEICHINQ